MFPLSKNNGKIHCDVNAIQIHAILALKEKMQSGVYRLVKNSCVCGAVDLSKDFVLSETDRYGFPIASIICGRCGLIRSANVFDAESNFKFYSSDYRSIYGGAIIPPDSFFEDQLVRGNNLYRLWKYVVPNGTNQCVLELGCGAGGILAPFAASGMACIGYDFDQHYLDYGKAKGLDLRCGDYNYETNDNSIGVFILSHVFEHFTNPVTELLRIVRKVAFGGYVIVDVPGIFSIHKVYLDPLQYLQNAHVYSYYQAFLAYLLEHAGLNVIYGDERCVCIARKPLDWVEPVDSMCHLDLFSTYPDRVKAYIAVTRFLYLSKLNPFYWKRKLISSRFIDTFKFRILKH